MPFRRRVGIRRRFDLGTPYRVQADRSHGHRELGRMHHTPATVGR